MTTDPQVRPTAPAQANFLTNLWDAKTARVLFTALLFALLLAFLHGARETLTLFLFAILFAYFLAPRSASWSVRCVDEDAPFLWCT